MRLHVFALILATAGSLNAQQLPAPSPYNTPQEWKTLARDVYKQLIEINTTDSNGNVTDAANAMAKRLLDAGFAPSDVQLLAPDPRKGNLIVRLRAKQPSARPLLLLAHLDVVEAKREDWSFDPFVFREQDGFFYGRGTTDDKAAASIFVTSLLRMKKEGITPKRDIILALTADEEGGIYNGVSWLLKNHRDAVDAAFGINEGGGGLFSGTKRLQNMLQASEKVFLSFRLESTNPGGHSSRPTRDNAIYHVANALSRLSTFEFPATLNEVTRAYFERMAKTQGGQTGADMLAVTRTPMDSAVAARLSENPYYNALLRTTCVATMVEAGHAENALPQLARATVNCRLLPGTDWQEVQQTLRKVIADEKVSITPMAPPKPSAPSPLTPEIMQSAERITEQMWPGVPVIPTMGTGATDGLYFRNAGIPIYGIDGLFEDMNDGRAHGKDERMAVQSFYEGQEFLWRLINALAVKERT